MKDTNAQFCFGLTVLSSKLQTDAKKRVTGKTMQNTAENSQKNI